MAEGFVSRRRMSSFDWNLHATADLDDRQGGHSTASLLGKQSARRHMYGSFGRRIDCYHIG